MVRTNRRGDKEFRYERVNFEDDSDEDDRSALTREDTHADSQERRKDKEYQKTKIDNLPLTQITCQIL